MSKKEMEETQRGGLQITNGKMRHALQTHYAFSYARKNLVDVPPSFDHVSPADREKDP
jgi:hypothetical protein